MGRRGGSAGAWRAPCHTRPARGWVCGQEGRAALEPAEAALAGMTLTLKGWECNVRRPHWPLPTHFSACTQSA